MKPTLVIALVIALWGCEKKKGEPSGIGRWRVAGSNPTTVKDVKDGICSKEPTSASGRPVTWCHQLPPIKAANRTATVDLYFDGHYESSPLIEVQLSIRGCVEDDLDRWIRGVMGVPVETRATRAYWQNSFMWVAALMPSDPGRCLVHILPLSEKTEIERIKQK